MKKIIILISLFLISSFGLVSFAAEDCRYTKDGDIKGSLNTCLKSTTLVKATNLDIGGTDFSAKINNITKTIATILSLGAVFGIVYGSFVMVTAAGEDEKIKKAKDIIKWSIIGFLGVVFASGLIALLVNFMYGLTK